MSQQKSYEENPRSIDALIAEHVMGWKLCFYDTGKYASTPDDYENASSNDGWLWEGRTDIDLEAWQFRPTTSIADAWLVVEKMKEKGLHCDIVVRVNGHYGCEFEDRYCIGEHDTLYSEGDTAPMAICLSALKALGVEVLNE